MTRTVELTPELEHFADECVTDGRYRDVSDVVRSALGLLKDYEEQRRQFTATLDEALEEADREGTFTVEEVVAEAQAIIDAHKR